MIKRYALTWEEIAKYRNFSREELGSFFKNHFNIYPGLRAPVITGNKPENLQLYGFGVLLPGKRLRYTIPTSDFLNGTQTQLPFKLRDLSNEQRCIIPAHGFYIFPSNNKPYFCFTHFGTFSFAGIWRKNIDQGENVSQNFFYLLTVEANRLMSTLGSAEMPVILKTDQEDLWLNKDTQKAVLENLLQPFPVKEMNAWHVDEKIRNSKHNSRLFSIPQSPLVQEQGWTQEPLYGTKRYLCASCCINKFLKLFVTKHSKHLAKCNICRKKKKCVLVDNNFGLVRLFRAIHRLTFVSIDHDELSYIRTPSGHVLLERGAYESKNPVLKNTSFQNFYRNSQRSLSDANMRIEYHIFLLEYLLGRHCYSSDLYDNYKEIEDYFELPLHMHPDNSVKIIEELFEQTKEIKSYSLNVSKAKEIIKRSISDKLVPKKISLLKKNFHRARLGYDKTESSYMNNRYFEGIPYMDKAIGAPPAELTKQGRLNIEGIPILYLSSDIHTAICEIRPEPGAFVSLAIFKPKSEGQKLIDLREINLLDFCATEADLLSYLLLTDLSKKLAQPVLSEAVNRYKITQILSEAIAELGYDGVLYNSAITQGYNLAIFDSFKFEYVEGSSSIHIVEKVKFNTTLLAKYKPRSKIRYDDPWYLRRDSLSS
jgi:putative SOS response-associated peptidase YedK